MKGQGATEYLVLLAVVLIVAMVAIVLLGFFPGLAVDAKISQSDAYWRGAVRPFAILEHSQSSTQANLTLVIQNKEAEQRVLNNITVSGSGLTGDYQPTGTNAYFSAGEKRTFYIPLTGGNCTQGNSYEYKVNFDYNNSDHTIRQWEYGEKPLVGKCS